MTYLELTHRDYPSIKLAVDLNSEKTLEEQIEIAARKAAGLPYQEEPREGDPDPVEIAARRAAGLKDR
jgi:L-alanine-DL-glutamate epimerase-like enolase superfamily enzyme